MQLDISEALWPAAQSAAFMRSRDRHGELSNMTGGFPLRVNGITFQSPEGLYQALKFSARPEIQQEIAAAPSGMAAKRAAYRHAAAFEPRWDDVKIDAMAFTLGELLDAQDQQALAQHAKVLNFGGFLCIVSYR